MPKPTTTPRRPKVSSSTGNPTMHDLPQRKVPGKPKKRVVKSNNTTDLTVLAKTMIHEGGSVVDVGLILACQQTEGGEEWLAELKKQGLSIGEFLTAATQRADIELIRVAARTALGYTYEEGSQEFLPEVDEEGKPTGKYAPGKKKVMKKHVRDTALLWNLMKSRMPEFFSETKRIEISRRSIEIKGDAEAEIRSFAGRLLTAMAEEQTTEFVEAVG